MDISQLNQPLEVSEKPGLEPFDMRFADIASLVENGKYMEAGNQCTEIVEEGIYDIRIIGYYLYAAFLENGLSGLGEIFEIIDGLASENMEAVGPVKNKEKHYQNSLKWFVNQLIKKLEYEEDQKGELWNEWIEEVSAEDVEQIVENLENMQKSLTQGLEDASEPVMESLQNIRNWLSSFHKIVYKEPEPEKEEEEEAGEPVAGEAAQAGPAGATFSLPGFGQMPVEGSFHFQQLLQKLTAFERLIQVRKYPLAALIAEDINDIIAHFDPRIYFPNIFARFSLLYAKNISEMINNSQNKNTVEWQALKKLYEVDLNSFVNFDDDIDFSTPSVPAPGVSSGGMPETMGGSPEMEEDYEEEYPEEFDDEYE